MARIYVASSWKNDAQPSVVEKLRDEGHKVYDFRHNSHGEETNVWTEIDPDYMSWSKEGFKAMLKSEKAMQRFNRHLGALSDADTCVLLLPCGRSAHSEAGLMAGMGKRVIVCDLSERPFPELMYNLFNDYVFSIEDLLALVNAPQRGVCRICGCTEENGCYHPLHGPCFWVDDSRTLCSHCADEDIADDPETIHCVRDVSDEFGY